MLMISSASNEPGKFLDPNIVCSVLIIEQKKVYMVFSLSFGTEILHAEILIVLIQRNDVDTYVRILFLEFWNVFDASGEGDIVEI